MESLKKMCNFLSIMVDWSVLFSCSQELSDLNSTENTSSMIMGLVCCYRISGQSCKHLAAQHSWITLNVRRTLRFHYMCGILFKWTLCSLRIWRQDCQSMGPNFGPCGFSIQSKPKKIFSGFQNSKLPSSEFYCLHSCKLYICLTLLI